MRDILFGGMLAGIFGLLWTISKQIGTDAMETHRLLREISHFVSRLPSNPYRDS